MNIIKNYGVVLVVSLTVFVIIAFLSLVNSFNKDTEKLASSIFSVSQAINKPTFVKDELLLKFKEGVSAEDEQEIIKNSNIKVKKEIAKIKVKVISVPEQALEAVAKALSNNPKVEFVENNYIAQITLIPNDPEYSKQWHLPKISAPNGWNINTGSKDVIIAIADTGVDLNHVDLATKLVTGYNFYDNNTDVTDINGHGTKVSGSAAAISNNGIGVTGVNWQSSIMPVKIGSPTGTVYFSDAAEGTIYAVDHGAKVINFSFGGSSYSTTLQNAVNYAWSKGAVIIASAGNHGTDAPLYPAALDNVVAVGATDSADRLTSFSAYGSWVDVVAPGQFIYSTINGGGYGSVSGTSFSSPITAGLAALIFAANPDLKNSDVVNLIKNNTDDLGEAGFDTYYAWGRINVDKTVAAATSVTPSVDLIAPTASITTPLNNDTVSNTKFVSVAAADNIGVARVELWKNDSLFASTISYPYSFAWDTTKEINGSFTLMAKAYDAAGNMGVSEKITVNVDNASDAISPTVSINQPTNNSTLSSKGTTLISVSANDNIGVMEIQIFFDGTLMTSCSQTNDCNNRFNPKKIRKGSHTINAKAYDAVGNMGSAMITVVK